MGEREQETENFLLRAVASILILLDCFDISGR